MCRCTPAIRTPWCGKPGCVAPPQKAGTVDGIKALSGVTGLDQQSLRDIWDAVRANHDRLNGCPRHNFEPVEASPGKMRTRWRCGRCLGEVAGTDVAWYKRGLEHAGVAR